MSQVPACRVSSERSLSAHLLHDDAELELAEAAEVVDQQDGAIGAVVLERDERAILVRG